MEGRLSGPAGGAGAVAVLALLLVSVLAFAATRELRSRPDVVNSVVVTERIVPGERAEIRFNLTEDDPRGDVLIIDADRETVRALVLAGPLVAGEQSFIWNGTGEDGQPVPPGRYMLRIVLPGHDRDIRPPGEISVGEAEG